jgi:hypothetical protein
MHLQWRVICRDRVAGPLRLKNVVLNIYGNSVVLRGVASQAPIFDLSSFLLDRFSVQF